MLPQRMKWIDAAEAEIAALEKKQTWEEVPMSNACSKIIPLTWVFRAHLHLTPVQPYKKLQCQR